MWLLNKTDTILSNQRNIGVHTPLFSFNRSDDIFGGDDTPEIVPFMLTGNKHALQVLGKDILKEYAHYEAQIRKMLEFASLLKTRIGWNRPEDRSKPWPERPVISAK